MEDPNKARFNETTPEALAAMKDVVSKIAEHDAVASPTSFTMRVKRAAGAAIDAALELTRESAEAAASRHTPANHIFKNLGALDKLERK